MKAQTRSIGLLFATLMSVGTVTERSPAQSITPETGINGTRTTVTLNRDRYDITGGRQSGINLFHSFQQFGLNAGETANLISKPGILNILGRVVGGSPSVINGTITVQGVGKPNLFLMNPAGIIFGANASLSVPASFTATTATGIGFGPNWFNATGANNYAALVGMPSSFVFNTPQPGAIVNAGNLSAGQGQNLTLLGGTVVSTGQLNAPGGQITVTAIPGENVVRISQAGNLLSLDIKPLTAVDSQPGWNLPILSLPQLLTGEDVSNATKLTVNSNGQVELAGSGLPVVNGDVAIQAVTTQTALLSAAHNLTLFESQLNTTGDMQLLAQDTVLVRDTQAHPFIAQAGGNLLIQGQQGIDIFALNHPQSRLFSNGDIVLRSQKVGGDAHYTAVGSFRVEQLDGSLGTWSSPADPIIRASGDVSFSSYQGASLHILAGGKVTISGSVEITGQDTQAGASIAELVTLSDGKTAVSINGATQPTLDIRAGTTAFGNAVGITGSGTFTPASPTISSSASGADITIGSITAPGGVVFLTNQYAKNSLFTGAIQVNGKIDTSSSAGSGGAVIIDSRTSTTTGGINTQVTKSFNDPPDFPIPSPSLAPKDAGGSVTLLSSGAIQVNGAINTSSSSGNGGAVSLKGNSITVGAIKTTSATSSSTFFTSGGDVNLTSVAGDTVVESIDSSSGNFSGGGGRGGDVTITASGLFRATGFVNSAGEVICQNCTAGISGVSIYAAGNLGKVRDAQGNLVLDKNGNPQSELDLPIPNQPFRGGSIKITQGGTSFLTGAKAAPNTNLLDPQISEFQIVLVDNFLIPNGVSGARGALVSRNVNGQQRTIFLDKSFSNVSPDGTSLIQIQRFPLL